MSTGGCPQFVLKKIELLRDEFEIYCVEYDFLSPDFVVQRNKVIDILGKNFIPLYNDKILIFDVINRINPDFIFIEEFCETFMNFEICKFIYNSSRNYKIIESTHGSIDRSDEKKFLPDKFIFVSEWSKKQYQHFEIPIDVIEYPVDIMQVKDGVKNVVSFDENKKHILNVGLFTPGKNQKYVFEIAEKLISENLKFHFVGNLALNFQDYWKSLIENKPDNCETWGERDNVEEYMMACDLFLFTSKFELNPLVIKEALSFNKKILMFNLETYCGMYENNPNIFFLSGDLTEDCEKIKFLLNL